MSTHVLRNKDDSSEAACKAESPLAQQGMSAIEAVSFRHCMVSLGQRPANDIPGGKCTLSYAVCPQINPSKGKVV